jgi:uncharacterized protein (TIGR03437 family)
MMRISVLTLVFLPCLAMAAAPAVQSVTDSAGYGPRVAPGSLASVFGTGFAGTTTTVTEFPLPTAISGTSVSVGGTLAPLLYVSATQINFQVPSSVKSGTASLVVNGPGGASSSFSFTVTAEAPSIFQYGTNHALAQNQDFTLNSDSSPAAAGSYIYVYLTGQGPVNNPVKDGYPTPASPVATATATATATIGPLNAPVQFLGLTSEFAGLAQANIQVPALPPGDYPLVITAGTYVGASAIVSISGSGTAYTTPLTTVSSLAFPNVGANNVVLFDNVAYVCGANRIVMVNVSNVNTPSEIGEFGDSVLNGSGNRCTVSTQGSIPFLVDIVGETTGTESFVVYSLNVPTSPALLTVASTPYNSMEDLSFSGNYGITTTSYLTYYTSNDGIASQTGDFLVFDFTNPAAPQFLTELQPSSVPGSGNQNLKPYVDVVNQSYAFVTSSTATGASTVGAGLLDVVDIALPLEPSPISLVTVPQAAILLSFDVSGTVLLAAGNTAGQRNPGNPDFDFTGDLTLTTMDLTNVQVPEVISTITTSIQVNGTFYTSAFANGVFAIVNKPPDTDNDGPSTLMIVDARNPANILLYPFSAQFGFSGILATNNGYLLAPTSLGLNIYQLQL